MKEISLTGKTRDFYKKLKEQKEAELGIALFGSASFVKRRDGNKEKWVPTFQYGYDGHFNNTDEIVSYYRAEYGHVGLSIALCETDGEEFRIWFKK